MKKGAVHTRTLRSTFARASTRTLGGMSKNARMKKIKITQVRSAIDRPKDQKATLRALGLRKMHQTVEKVATPQIMGMVAKVSHLVKVEEV